MKKRKLVPENTDDDGGDSQLLDGGSLASFLSDVRDDIVDTPVMILGCRGDRHSGRWVARQPRVMYYHRTRKELRRFDEFTRFVNQENEDYDPDADTEMRNYIEVLVFE